MRPPRGAADSPVPNLEFQLNNYAGRIKALSIVWFVYGGLSLVLGFIGLAFANAFFPGQLRSVGAWALGSRSAGARRWFGRQFCTSAGPWCCSAPALAFVAGWGLMERARWGRVVAIVASFLFLIKIPIGTALGIWTLVTLLGYRNSTLYEQL